MRTLTALALIGWGTAVGALFTSEMVARNKADDLVRQGQPRAAFRSYDRLIAAEPFFLPKSDLERRRKHTALAALEDAISSHNFSEAVHYANFVLGEPGTSGIEAAVADVASRLPDQHAEWVTDLLRAEKPAEAAREIQKMRTLYPKRQDLLARAITMEAEAHLIAARQRLDAGDPRGTVKELAETSVETPVAAQTKVAALVRRAVIEIGDHHLNIGDYPGLYRELARLSGEVQHHPHLARQIAYLQAAFTERLFGASANGPLALNAADHVPTPERIGESLNGEAVLQVENKTAAPLAVHLKGPEDHKITIPSGQTKELKLRAGEFVQFAHQVGRVRPHLGILQLEGKIHQTFRVSRAGTSG